MGSFSQLTISDYPIFLIKNGYIDELVKLIFLPEDFITEQRTYSTKNKLVWGVAYENNDEEFTFKGFRQTAKNCRSRLEIYGATTQKAKKDFNIARRLAKNEAVEIDISYDFPISKISYENYLDEVKDIIYAREINYEQSYNNLRNSLIAGELSIYGQEIRYNLFSILSVVADDAIVEYDLSDIIEGGWIKETNLKHIDIEKIIILTEGKTDAEFIGSSLLMLYPHLFNYYHFIDFAEYKVESNASALVKLVKSFAASNVQHPIIALFDNDTAGISEMKNLLSLKLPENFKILKLPNLELTKKYPTIGPTGIKKMNINGFACGIEMYLGVDILTNENMLIPIQWKGFNEKEKKYQGEISNKQYVQDLFRNKIRIGKTFELPEMKLLLMEVFNAFK